MNCFKHKVFYFKNFSKDFCEYIKTENLNYKSKNIERKCF